MVYGFSKRVLRRGIFRVVWTFLGVRSERSSFFGVLIQVVGPSVISFFPKYNGLVKGMHFLSGEGTISIFSSFVFSMVFFHWVVYFRGGGLAPSLWSTALLSS